MKTRDAMLRRPPTSPSPDHHSQRRFARGLRRLAQFRGNERGATAVEFSIVALPFIFMIMATFELAIVFLISVTLDSATAAAARSVRTGQTIADGVADTNGQNSFKSTICSNMGWLQSQCSSNLYIDVRTMSSFQNQNPPSIITALNNSTYNTNHCYYSGNAGDIVLVRTYFTWTLLTPFLNAALSRLNNGQAVISSTATFMNEPFGNAPQNVSSQC